VSKADEYVDQIKEFVFKNRRLTMLQVADMLEIIFASVQNILKDKHPEKWNSGNLFLHHDGELGHGFFCA
jgi:hypothetical protein